MKKGQERRGTLTTAAPLVLVEVVTRAAAARVRPTSTDALVLTAVSPVCAGIDGCRGTGHPSPSCPGLPGAAEQRLLQGFKKAPSTLRQEGKVPGWWPEPTNKSFALKIQGQNTVHLGWDVHLLVPTAWSSLR